MTYIYYIKKSTISQESQQQKPGIQVTSYKLQVSAPALSNAMTTNTFSFQLLSSQNSILKMTLFNQPCLYSKIDKEDPEEVSHRRAKFLIYKTLQKADVVSRRSSHPSSFLRMKLLRLKAKIGKSLTKLRRNIVSAVRFGGIQKHSQSSVRALKKMFHGGATNGLPRPIFALEVWFLIFFYCLLCISPFFLFLN